MEVVLLKFDILNLSRYKLQTRIPPSHSTVVPKLIMILAIDSSLMDQNSSKRIKYGIIHSHYLVMEEVVLLKFDILSLSRYQLQMRIPPSHYTVVPKLIMILA
jgi:type III secretion system FlhB-like substrate exporter